MSWRLFVIVPFIAFISCGHQDGAVPSSLYGRWVLDSTSGRAGKMIKGGPREHTEFTLRTDGSFNYKWSDDDVMGEHDGRFTFENGSKTKKSILILPVYSEKNDTLIILKLTDSILKTQERESYTLLDSTLITQNRINIYRKTAKKSLKNSK